MVLRHYGVPTRLLDWSLSPYVATYFAVSDQDDLDGELWTSSYDDYRIEGEKQWRKCPQTTTDGSGDHDKFAAGLTAFSLDIPDDCNWIIAAFYPKGFPRQKAQSGAYTLTARFNIDHADALMTLLGDSSRYHRYVIDAGLKTSLRATLLENYGIWRGSLFPDTAGAAETAGIAFHGFDNSA